ncbi:hypothetical protein [Halorubrum sp. AS12]|uniref:hypothetical protein n=1 Tax=Halorubrum sp. AS12 TaxID=3409687 RepID=UPI003DA70FD1
MSEDDDDVSARDALAIAQRALARVNEFEDRIDQLEVQRGELQEDLTAVKLRLSEIDDERPYKSLSIDEKVGMVREHAFRKAVDRNGRAKLDYDDVMYEVFDGKPGSKHCYKLIRLAAGLDPDSDEKTGGTIPGFTARDPSSGNYHLAVNAAEAKRGEVFFPRTKTGGEGVV